jgi:SLT domain-containing protein
MSLRRYLKDLASDIELLENNGLIKEATVLHEKFIRVATFPHRKDVLVDRSFEDADRWEDDQKLMNQANEDYYGEMKDNPDEDIVDDSLASDFDHETNEMNLTDDADNDHESVYGLINQLRDKLSSDRDALSLLKQLEDMYDSSAMGER